MLALLRQGGFRAFRATENLKIRFSFQLESDCPVLLQLMNETQGKHFKKNFGIQKSGRWIRLTVDVMNDLSTNYAAGKDSVKLLDLFNELRFYSGNPGKDSAFLLDDIEIFRKIYR